MTVNTAYSERRLEYSLASATAMTWSRPVKSSATMREADEVSPNPKADVILVELAASVNPRARWWTTSRLADEHNAQDHVITRGQSNAAAKRDRSAVPNAADPAPRSDRGHRRRPAAAA